MNELATLLPGMGEFITCPEYNPEMDTNEKMKLNCRGGQVDLMRVIIHLNDHHHWSREDIADWVDAVSDLYGFSTDFEQELFTERSE